MAAPQTFLSDRKAVHKDAVLRTVYTGCSYPVKKKARRVTGTSEKWTRMPLPVGSVMNAAYTREVASKDILERNNRVDRHPTAIAHVYTLENF